MAITGAGAQGSPCVHGVPLGRDQKCRACAEALADLARWSETAGTSEGRSLPAITAHDEALRRFSEAGLAWVGVRR